MPINFYRHLAPDQGFPPFGEMTLANDHAYQGDWSFRFDLDGGSMAARIPTAIIPVAPLADYRITVMVRTEGLVNATARMAAWFHDTAGNPILISRTQTDSVQSDSQWTELAVTVTGDYADAGDLVVELLLEQPRQAKRFDGDPLDPVLSDVVGRAWFDELIIRHQPRIVMQTNPRGNLIGPGQSIGLDLLVRDVASEHIDTILRIYDFQDALVHEQMLPAPRGPQPRHIPLTIERAGWYRAQFTILSAGEPIRQREIDFAVLAPTPRIARIASNRFALVVPETAAIHADQTTALIRNTQARRAVLPIWPRDPERNDADVQGLIDPLIGSSIEIIGALNAIPPLLASDLNMDADQVPEILAAPDAPWKPYLQDHLIRYGLEINQWVIGHANAADTAMRTDVPGLLESARAALGEFSPRPVMIAPWPAGFEPDPSATDHALSVLIPHHVRPTAIEAFIEQWPGPQNQFVIQPLPENLYTPRQRAGDLVLRILHAWRAGAPMLALDGPWRLKHPADVDLSPDVLYPVWRTLADLLNDRTVVEKLDVGPYQHCWLLEGPTPDDGLMVAWTERPMETIDPSHAPALNMVLGPDPVTTIDVFGNRARLAPRSGIHHVPISDLPLFIEDASHELGMFRAAFEIVPSFLTAESRIHEHEMVLKNPWDIAITGTIQVNPDRTREILPSTHEFTIKPGQQIRLPVEVLVDRRILAGPQVVAARINISADREYQLEVRDRIKVGLQNLDVAVNWYVARNEFTGRRDLIIVQSILNRGDDTVSLDCFVLAPAIQRRTKPVPDLAPGASIHRSFRITDGVELLSGKTLRVGIIERETAGRLNYTLNIPDFNIAERAASADQSP